MVDGDKALVIQDETIINVAKRDMVGVVPLYYEMLKAKDELLTSERMFTALTSAYKANIGIISNEITKIWNTPNPNVEAVKWLCCLNNYTIDFAKTLYMPEKPAFVDEELKKFSKMKLPHFFKYAKDKEEDRVDSVNESTVNKLNSIIPNKPIQFKKVVGDYDYTLLLNNKRIKENLNQEIIDTFVKTNRIKKYLYNSSEFSDSGFNEYLKSELSKISKSENYVCDVLTYYLYNNGSKNKETLWKCYGDILFENLNSKLENTMCCEECDKRVERESKRQLYCNECSIIMKKKKTKERVAKYRKV